MTNSNRPSLPDLPPGLTSEQRVLMTRYAMQAVSEALAAVSQAAAQPAKAPRVCGLGTENVCLPCFLDHGECTAPVALPPFDGVEEAQMAARSEFQKAESASKAQFSAYVDAHRETLAGFDPCLQTR